MFTIKYRTFMPSASQPVQGPINYCCHEQIHGPYAFISQEVNDDGYIVIYTHLDDDAPGMMFGPWMPPETAGDQGMRPTLWVMNENGATVAKYDL